MKKSQFQFKKLLAASLILLELVLASNFLLIPNKADAVFGISDFTFNFQVGNAYDVAKDIGLAIAQRLAIAYANKYLQRFSAQLIDKYRIKSYLFYTQVLTGYYINQYIYQKVDDPNLRAIFNLLATDVNSSATVIDSTTGQRVPLLTALRNQLDKYYVAQGGISTSFVTNPPQNITGYDYYLGSYSYFMNPPDFTSQTLYAQYQQVQAQAQAAANQEIADSNGLKNDRSLPKGDLPHICDFTGPVQPGQPNPRDNQANCAAVGGTWKIDATGVAEAVIQNPSSFIQGFADKAIQNIFTNNFGTSNNIYSAIGTLLGNFIFDKLNLSSDGGTMNEIGPTYSASSYNSSIPTKEIDIDKDGIPDGQDGDNDGKLDTVGVDICYHGGVPGTPPGCSPSSSTSNSPYFTNICTQISQSVLSVQAFHDFAVKWSSQLYDNENFTHDADANIWAEKASAADSTVTNLQNAIDQLHITKWDQALITIGEFESWTSAVAHSLYADNDLDLDGEFSVDNPPVEGATGVIRMTQLFVDYLNGPTGLKQDIGSHCNNPGAVDPSQTTPPDWGFGTGSGGSSYKCPTTGQIPLACQEGDHTALVNQVISYLISKGINVNSPDNCGAYEVARRVAWMLRNDQAGNLITFHSSKCATNGISGDLIAFPDNSLVDILSIGTTSAGGGHWIVTSGANPNPEAGVSYTPATDPGDPADACYITSTCP